MTSEEACEKTLRLHKLGVSTEDISTRVNRKIKTVRRYIRESPDHRSRRDQPARQYTILEDAVILTCRKYKITCDKISVFLNRSLGSITGRCDRLRLMGILNEYDKRGNDERKQHPTGKRPKGLPSLDYTKRGADDYRHRTGKL